MAQALLTTSNVQVTKTSLGFRLRFAYSESAVRLVKSIRGARWNRDGRFWALPNMDRDVLADIVARLDACFAAEALADLEDACVGQDYSPADLLRKAAEDDARESARYNAWEASPEGQREVAAWNAKSDADAAYQRRARRTGIWF